MDETPLEVAQRHVAEAEARVAVQTTRVKDLAHRGLDTGQAQALLVLFEQTLRFMREDLVEEQERAAGSSLPT